MRVILAWLILAGLVPAIVLVITYIAAESFIDALMLFGFYVGVLCLATVVGLLISWALEELDTFYD